MYYSAGVEPRRRTERDIPGLVRGLATAKCRYGSDGNGVVVDMEHIAVRTFRCWRRLAPSIAEVPRLNHVIVHVCHMAVRVHWACRDRNFTLTLPHKSSINTKKP